MSWAAVASAAGGALVGYLGNKGSKAGAVTTAGSNTPWEAADPYLRRGFHEAGMFLNEGFQPALSPVTQEAKNLALSTLRGDSLNSNPFVDQGVSRAMGEAQSRINSQFGPFNNFGSSAHQEWMGRGLMDAALPYLSQNYENERGRQFAALSQTPALAGIDYQNTMAPWDILGRYQNIVGAGGGGMSSSQTPYFTNPGNSALGGALLGNQLYNQFTKPNNWGMDSQTASSFPW